MGRNYFLLVCVVFYCMGSVSLHAGRSGVEPQGISIASVRVLMGLWMLMFMGDEGVKNEESEELPVLSLSRETQQALNDELFRVIQASDAEVRDREAEVHRLLDEGASPDAYHCRRRSLLDFLLSDFKNRPQIEMIQILIERGARLTGMIFHKGLQYKNLFVLCYLLSAWNENSSIRFEEIEQRVAIRNWV